MTGRGGRQSATRPGSARTAQARGGGPAAASKGSRPAGAGKGSGPAGAGKGPAAARSTVSTGSAARFAARVRRRRNRRIAIITGVVVVIAAVVAAGLIAPWATVERIAVAGTHRLPAGVVRDAATSELGRPLLLADLKAVADRVREQTLVRGVIVTRTWPGTLSIRVVEREPVAAVPGPGGVTLVDPDGVRVAEAARAPAGLPLVQVNLATAGPAALRAVVAVLAGLSPPLREQVRSAGATSADSVWLTLADGSRVLWGSSDAGAAKVDALTALRRSRGTAGLPRRAVVVYDVSAPGAPAVRAAS